MLKRIFTRLKEFRLPFAMAEPAEKRTGQLNEEPEKKKQKTGQSQTEARLDRKRKVALLISYNGKGYYGLQINRGFQTIEGVLCKALVDVGLIPQDHSDDMQKMSFQRAARTDKGVSAASNVISLKISYFLLFKMLLNLDNFIDKVNEQLPPEIRVMDCKRTTNSFNSKNFCDSRTYIYLLPTFAFAPVEENVTHSYRTNQEIMDRVNRVLKLYLGTHRFHNFTSGLSSEDGSCKRYIKYIECGQPFVRNGVEFAIISVHGQSFMLHQIRKMIGLSIAIVKGYCNDDAIEVAWNPERLDVPKAPGLGLVLEKLHYDGYNKRYGGDGVHERLDWSHIQDKIDKFKEEQIFSEIIKTELEENSMMNWLSTLMKHSYDTETNFWYKRNALAKLKTKDSGKESDVPGNESEPQESDKTIATDLQPLKIDSTANQIVDDKDIGTNQTNDNISVSKSDSEREAKELMDNSVNSDSQTRVDNQVKSVT